MSSLKIKNIALITPLNGDWTYDSLTILDGCIQLQKSRSIKFFISDEANSKYHPFPTKKYALPKKEFISFAKNNADIILLFWSKKNTNFGLAEEIGEWNKTIYIDGSELGKDKWRDFSNQYKILNGNYRDGYGGIDERMRRLCLLYFRREKPYPRGIIPLPFGIVSVFKKYYEPDKEKDIDFFCVWGQDEFPLMRRYVQKILVKFCKENGFTYWIGKTKNRDEFYEKLSRSKVGISVSGGGYDTARFWEILANNCILLTEKIDIFYPDSKDLNYRRIYQFNNLYDFQYQLEKIGKFLRKGYRQSDLNEEYSNILSRHSSESRVLTIIKEAEKRLEMYKKSKEICSVLVSSCDAYSDLWEPFFTLFFRYWPNCPFEVYLISNYKSYSDKRVKVIRVGKDKGWALNMKAALSRVNNPYFILLHEEFFLNQLVDTKSVIDLLDFIQKEGADCIRLNPAPGPDKPYQNLFFIGELSSQIPYRFSLQSAIWDKKSFNNILGNEVKIWNVESEGTHRANKMSVTLLSVKNPVVYYDPRSAVVRGKFQYKIVQFCKKEGINLNLKNRSIDYEIAWRDFLNRIRKNFIFKYIKNKPVISKLFKKIYKLIYRLPMNKILK